MMKLVQLTDPDNQLTFLVGEKYGVGRKAAASEGYDEAHWISFPSDQSISRLHAEIMVEHPVANVRNPDLLPTLIVIDMGSKFNTYSKTSDAEERLALNAREPCKLADGDIVRFGRQWNEYKVRYEPCVVTGSTLKDSKKIQTMMRQLGGHFVAEWSEKCNFLLMESVTLTMKAVCALLSSAPIVTPRYFEDMVGSVRSRTPFHNAYDDYIPPFVEPSLSGLPVDLKPSGNKGKLFAGKTFVYWTFKQIDKLQPAVDAGGGTSVLISDCAEAVMRARDVLLFQSPVGYTMDAAAKRRLDAYQEANKRLIGESEMSLAALHKNLKKHCNPYFDYQPKIIPTMSSQTQQFVAPQPVIVPETQDEATQSFHPGSRYVVEESINISLRSTASPSQHETELGNTRRRGTKHTTNLDDTEVPTPKRRCEINLETADSSQEEVTKFSIPFYIEPYPGELTAFESGKKEENIDKKKGVDIVSVSNGVEDVPKIDGVKFGCDDVILIEIPSKETSIEMITEATAQVEKEIPDRKGDAFPMKSQFDLNREQTLNKSENDFIVIEAVEVQISSANRSSYEENDIKDNITKEKSAVLREYVSERAEQSRLSETYKNECFEHHNLETNHQNFVQNFEKSGDQKVEYQMDFEGGILISVASTSSTSLISPASQRSTQKAVHKKSSKTLSAIFGTSDSDSDDEIFKSSRTSALQVDKADRSSSSWNRKDVDTLGTENEDDDCQIVIPGTPESPGIVDVSNSELSQLSRAILTDELMEVQSVRGNNLPQVTPPDSSSSSQRKRGRDLHSPGDTSLQSNCASASKKPRGDLSSWVQVKSTNTVVKIEVEPSVTEIFQNIKIENGGMDAKPKTGCIRAPVIEKSLIKRRESFLGTPVDQRWAGMKNFKTFQKVLPGARCPEGSASNELVGTTKTNLYPPMKIGRLVIPGVDGRYNWDKSSQEENIPDISVRAHITPIPTNVPNHIPSPTKSDFDILAKPTTSVRKITRRQRQTEDASEIRSRQGTQERVMMNIDANRGEKLPQSQGTVDPSDGLFDF